MYSSCDEHHAHQVLINDVAQKLIDVSNDFEQASIRLLGTELDESRARSGGMVCWKLRTNYYCLHSYQELMEKLKRSLKAFLNGRDVVVLTLSFYEAKLAVELASSLLLKHIEGIASLFLRTEVETIQDFDVLDRDRLTGFSLCNFYGAYLCYLW